MKQYHLSDLLDMTVVQRLADANYRATGMPFSIIDALDGTILVNAGWQDICTKFHRIDPETLRRCHQSDDYIKDHLREARECQYKCGNGMWHVGMPIIIGGEYLATFFLSQFFYEGEIPERSFFVDQARQFGFDRQEYLAAFDRVPVFTRETVDNILSYNRSLVRFLADLGESALHSIRADQALRESEDRFRTIFDTINDAIVIQDIDTGAILEVNRRMSEMYGYRFDEIPFITVADLSEGSAPYDAEHARQWIARARTLGPQLFEWHARDKAGSLFWVEVSMRTVSLGGRQRLLVTVRDISERKKAQEERLRLEDQLRQAQKMESIGMLAGGIAHDFNNLLTPILGYAEIIAGTLKDDDHRLDQLLHIKAAADRARNLTSQLLAFSRRQILDIRAIDLHTVVRAFTSILRRTIRENVIIEVILPETPIPARADAGQIEQVLMNLAINAQDAMPAGGTLTIQVGSTVLDQPYVFTHPGIKPGRYVVLTISDTGAGMDAGAKQHLFEPFFTTKREGTGLGLSMVYGIVKQHEGGIYVYSEPGIGTTFKIYLPEADAGLTAREESLPRQPRRHHTGTETIMLVEDNDMVRDIAIEMLQLLGYRVLAPITVEECDTLVESLGPAIDMLLTDIVLPELNGRQLYTRLRAQLPSLKVLFMSGYTTNIIAHDGVLDEGINFIQKPLTMQALSEKIRLVLDA